VRAFCASLKEDDRTLMPRKTEPKSTAKGISVRKMITTDQSGSATSIPTISESCSAPVWNVSSMLPRFSAAATTPMSATVTNLPATIAPGGAGAVSSASSVPRSFSPAARSMAG
jgi:hypothetical protein